jgi:hypothetical protein
VPSRRPVAPALLERLTAPGPVADVDGWSETAAVGFDALVPVVAEVLDPPVVSAERAISFVLHAPLELLARISLHRRLRAAGALDEGTAHKASLRLVSLAARYSARVGYAPDVVVADPAPTLAALAERTVDATAAAGHGNIYVHLRRAVPTDDLAPMTRGLERELDAFPEPAIEFVKASSASSVAAAVGDLPRIGEPPGWGIAALVAHARTGATPELARLAATVAQSEAGRRDLLRCAAGMMVVGADATVPYGWTHALTLAQGALGVEPLVSRPARATTAAAVHAGSFWAAHGDGPLPLLPAEAEPGWWHDPARRALAAHDAHLVKYTLACVELAALDPAASGLYDAASRRLHSWWDEHPPADDPLARSV